MPTPTIVHVKLLPTGPDDGVPFDAEYVEDYWLPLLGPTPWAVLRDVHWELDDMPGQVVGLGVERLARRLGVAGNRAWRSFGRLANFALAQDRDGVFVFPRTVARLSRHHVALLPDFLREEALHGKA